MTTVVEVGSVVLMGVALLVMLGAVGAGSLLLLKAFATGEQWLELQKQRTTRKIAELDTNPTMLEFGQSPVGQAANQYLQRGLKAVDSPDDPFIQSVFKLPGLRQAYNAGLLTPDEFSAKASEIFRTGILLTDGVPNVEVRVQTRANSSEAVG